MGKLVRFLQGSVRIRLTGVFPERFLNLCGTSGVAFWGAEQQGELLLFVTIPLFQLHRAEALARRCQCEMERIATFGLPAFLWRFRRRYALLAGFSCALLGAIFLSRFVLVVNVTGNETIPDSVILTELDCLGFGVGSYGPGVNRRELANEALLRLRELSFLSVNISGIYAEIVVREAAPEPEIESDEPGDITAAVDGVIADVDALVGQALVEPGDAVLAGEVLISGTKTYESGDGSGTVLSSAEVRAEGSVWAYTLRRIQAETPLRVRRRGERIEGSGMLALRILRKWLRLPGRSSICDPECEQIKQICALTLPGGEALPLAVERTKRISCRMEWAEVDLESAEAYLTERLEERLSGAIGQDGTILSQTFFRENTGEVLTLTLEASCLEQIGVEEAGG